MNMTDTHLRFELQCFVSFKKFENSIERVLDRTFDAVNFNPAESLLPTYIAVEVAPTTDETLLKATRKFFEHLRAVHQTNFVRFVTDTVWAMESHNGDIFYCEDGDKRKRADIIWSIKALSPEQFEINIVNTEDNQRREILTDLQHNIDRLYKAHDCDTVESQLEHIVNTFYSKTKNIKSLKTLDEDCHIVLMPLPCGTTFQPVLICGMSQLDAKRRWNAVKGQITYQQHQYPQLFPVAPDVVELLQAPIDLMNCNTEDDEEFDLATHYEAAELAFVIYDGSSRFFRTACDTVIIHTKPDGNIVTQRRSLDELTQVN